MDVIERIERGETPRHDAVKVVLTHDEFAELLRLARLGAAAEKGTDTICDWQEYDGQGECQACPSQYVCQLRREVKP
jgi:hypothetical protein